MPFSIFSTYFHYYPLYSKLSKIPGWLLPQRHYWIKYNTMQSSLQNGMKQQPVYFTPKDHYCHTDLIKIMTHRKHVPPLKFKSNWIYFIKKLSTVFGLNLQGSKSKRPKIYIWLSSSQKQKLHQELIFFFTCRDKQSCHLEQFLQK